MPSRLTMLPQFILPDDVTPAEFFAALRRICQDPDVPYVGQVLDRHAFLQSPRKRRTLLSPYLNLRTVEIDGKDRVRGRFPPHPAAWTGFMAVYGVLIMVSLAALVYGASLIGQGLTQDEMFALRVCVERLACGEDPLRRGSTLL